MDNKNGASKIISGCAIFVIIILVIALFGIWGSSLPLITEDWVTISVDGQTATIEYAYPFSDGGHVEVEYRDSQKPFLYSAGVNVPPLYVNSDETKKAIMPWHSEDKDKTSISNPPKKRVIMPIVIDNLALNTTYKIKVEMFRGREPGFEWSGEFDTTPSVSDRPIYGIVMQEFYPSKTIGEVYKNLWNNPPGLSYDFVIMNHGEIYCMGNPINGPMERVNWHSGASEFPGYPYWRTGVNHDTVSIALPTEDTITETDYQSAAWLVEHLKTLYPTIREDFILGHKDVSLSGKEDPYNPNFFPDLNKARQLVRDNPNFVPIIHPFEEWVIIKSISDKPITFGRWPTREVNSVVIYTYDSNDDYFEANLTGQKREFHYQISNGSVTQRVEEKFIAHHASADARYPDYPSFYRNPDLDSIGILFPVKYSDTDLSALRQLVQDIYCRYEFCKSQTHFLTYNDELTHIAGGDHLINNKTPFNKEDFYNSMDWENLNIRRDENVARMDDVYFINAGKK